MSTAMSLEEVKKCLRDQETEYTKCIDRYLEDISNYTKEISRLQVLELELQREADQDRYYSKYHRLFDIVSLSKWKTLSLSEYTALKVEHPSESALINELMLNRFGIDWEYFERKYEGESQ